MAKIGSVESLLQDVANLDTKDTVDLNNDMASAELKEAEGPPKPLPVTTSEAALVVVKNKLNELDLKDPTVNFSDNRRLLPNDIDDKTGLMEVLVIGDQNFSLCPITQISYSQSMQFVRFSALRTVGDPKIANNTMPNNITVNIIFPNASAINTNLAALVAQFMVTPVTKVQSRFISRVLKSVDVNHHGGLTANFENNVSKSAEDETMWMIMTDFNIKSIPNFPEAYEAYITLEVFEERVFGGSMDFLKSYEDVKEKYRRKMNLINGQYCLPSEKSMLEVEEWFRAGNINVVLNPAQSSLYKTFYKAVQNEFLIYDPASYNGRFIVLYNDQNLDREAIRNNMIKLEEAYNQTLEQTATIFANAGPKFESYLRGEGFSTISVQDVRILAGSLVQANTDMLAMVAKTGPMAQIAGAARFAAVNPIVRIGEIKRNANSLIDQVCTNELRTVDKELFTAILNKSLGYLGVASSWSEGLTSVGMTDNNGVKLRDKLKNVGDVDISSGGVLGGLEVLVGQKLYNIDNVIMKDGTNNVNVSSNTAKTSGTQLDLLTKAITKLARLTLFNSDKSPLDLNDAALAMNPLTFKSSILCDGSNSITTGISFSISNKVVPQQIIGWRQPMYQHLGRSDWSINMNILCKGDDSVREIMYIMNRIGLFSKQIQFTTPARFMNLDTTLHIAQADPIFASLGINKVVLNTAEISSVQGQPNTYQISLGLEQADLSIRDMEKLAQDGKLKETNKQVSNVLLNEIVPVLKALVVRPSHPDFGRFLDFEKIKEVVNNKALDPFWEAYNLGTSDPSNPFDYMDKYNYYKIIRQAENVVDPISDYDTVVADAFPVGQVEASTRYDYQRAATKELYKAIHGEDNLAILEQDKLLASLNDLVIQESLSNLIWKHGSLTDSTKSLVVKSLEPYYKGLMTVINQSFVQVSDDIKKLQGDRPTTTGQAALNGVNTGVQLGTASAFALGIAGNYAVAIGVLSTNPIGWGILIASVLIGAAVYGTMSVLDNAAESTKAAIKDIVTQLKPDLFNKTINASLIDLTKDFIIDDKSLKIFSSNFKLSSSEDSAYLQSRIAGLRKLLVLSMNGCYNDFEVQLKDASIASSLPVSVLDPAFYLYSRDFITTSLVREAQADITSQMGLLGSRVTINAMILGREAQEAYKIDPKNFDDMKQPPPTSEFFNKNDVKWLMEAKKKITELQLAAFNAPTKQNLQDAADQQSNNIDKDKPLYKAFYGESGGNKYWDQTVIDERTGAGLEQVFAKLQLLNYAFRHESIKTSFAKACENVREASNKIQNTDWNSDQAKAYLDLHDLLMKKQEYIEPEVLSKNSNAANDPNVKKYTWYEAIIKRGSINDPYSPSTSVDAQFKAKYKVSMLSYFKSVPELATFVEDVDIMSRCKKATTNGIAASMLVKQMALSGDPRMLEKRVNELSVIGDMMKKASITDNTGNPIRIFPTYKIYFIEEDAPEWGIYNDFYDYSAIQEITVVKDRKSASDTCVIKLSNVMGKLTDSFAENIPEYGTMNLAMTSMMLKAGTSILVKMGYSNSQVELPVVFHGIIVEVNPGPIVEVVCQSYGAELNEILAPGSGIKFGVFGTVKALGDVATWALQAATGLNHFGKMGYADYGTTDKMRLSGTNTTGLQGKIKLASFITGLPGLSINDPRDDNIYLPYNMAAINDKAFKDNTDLALTYLVDKFRIKSNITFDWYIRDQSIWDIIHELCIFSPDFIHVVLPYNDNIFPFIPKIRNTLYVGPKRGYYKYTDAYAIISKDPSTVNFSNSGALETLMLEAARNMAVAESEMNSSLGALIANGGGLDQLSSNIALSSIFDQLLKLFANDNILYNMVYYKYGIATTGVININFANIKNIEATGQLIQVLKKFRSDLTNYDELVAGDASSSDFNALLKMKPNRSLAQDMSRAITDDVGFNGMYYNRYGNHHQYKKVQTHHIVTNYTNIISNNIIASAEGWANQIKLLCPPDPTSYKSIEDVPINDRDDFITTVFNLDDNIYDDQIRPKSVFINNVDPSMYDDSYWAQDMLNGTAPNTTVCTRTNQYITRDLTTGAPTVSGLYIFNKEGDVTKTSSDAASDGGILPTLTNGQPDKSYTRSGYELMPSKWRVGISLLAEEARDMYNGELIVTGDSTIRPYDIIHLMDYTNDMHGSFEVGRVIHSISPQNGFTTRIKPDLIVNQKNKFNEQEIMATSQMLNYSVMRSVLGSAGATIGMGAGIYGVGTLLQGLVNLLGGSAVVAAGGGEALTAATAAANIDKAKIALEAAKVAYRSLANVAVDLTAPALLEADAAVVAAESVLATSELAAGTLGLTGAGVAGAGVAGAGGVAATTEAAAGITAASVSSAIGICMGIGLAVGVGIVGYKAYKHHHERILMMMNNIIGRDSMEIMPLTYKGVPYVAGIEGYKKDSYFRHMYSMALDGDNLNIFERMGIMNSPMEFDFYKNVAGDNSVMSFIETSILNPGSPTTASSVGGFLQGTIPRSK